MFDLSSIESQGDEADCMYFIEDGEVRVTVKNQVYFCHPMTPPPGKKREKLSPTLFQYLSFFVANNFFFFLYIFFLFTSIWLFDVITLFNCFFIASVSISLLYWS